MGNRGFELTEEHITLLRTGCVSINQDDMYWGSVGLDVKRPFGDSDIVSSMAELLGVQRIEIDGGAEVWPAGTSERMHKLYQELATAMEIVLRTGAFEPGTYEATDYSSNWRLKRSL